MATLIWLMVLGGALYTGGILNYPHAPEPAGPDMPAAAVAVRQDPAGPGEAGFVPMELHGCRTPGTQVRYRDLSRAPAIGAGDPLPAPACGKACADD